MLLAVALAGLGLALFTQIGMGSAEFEVWENDLILNDSGLVEGELLLGYEGDEYSGTTWPVECKISQVDRPSLLDLKPKSKYRITYRVTTFWPLEKQEPCALFLTRCLGIKKVDIVGYVTFKHGTEVVINGHR